MNRTLIATEVIDDLLTEAKAKIAQLQADLAVEQMILAGLERKRATINQPPAPIAPVGNATASASGTSPQPTHRTEEGKMPQLLIRIIREAGGRIGVHELVRLVKETGFSTTAKKGPQAIVHSTLSRRRDLFARIGKGEYALVGTGRQNTNGR